VGSEQDICKTKKGTGEKKKKPGASVKRKDQWGPEWEDLKTAMSHVEIAAQRTAKSKMKRGRGIKKKKFQNAFRIKGDPV